MEQILVSSGPKSPLLKYRNPLRLPLILTTLVLVLAWQQAEAGEVVSLANIEGKEISAEITNYDPAKGVVTLKTHGRIFELPMSKLSLKSKMEVLLSKPALTALLEGGTLTFSLHLAFSLMVVAVVFVVVTAVGWSLGASFWVKNWSLLWHLGGYFKLLFVSTIFRTLRAGAVGVFWNHESLIEAGIVGAIALGELVCTLLIVKRHYDLESTFHAFLTLLFGAIGQVALLVGGVVCLVFVVPLEMVDGILSTHFFQPAGLM